jgi:hypothetical protein
MEKIKFIGNSYSHPQLSLSFFSLFVSSSIQYGCKMLWFILWKTKSNKEYIEILKKLEATMSTTRKGS